MKTLSLILILLFVAVGSVSAQTVVTPEVPFTTLQPPTVITQLPQDARAPACNAYQHPNFSPYIVRAGDTLAGLLADLPAMTVTEVAALNCIDDPDALPVGSVVFLPRRHSENGAPGMTSDPAAIIGFAASAEQVINSDPVTFTWTGTGHAAYFFACPPDPDADCTRPATATALPVEGSMTLDGFSYTGTFRYGLEIVGTGDPASEVVSVDVLCAQEWLGGVGALPLCPEEPPRTVFAAWQAFEHGAMIWFSDTQQIAVMSEDGTFRYYADTYVDGQPDPGDRPPEGLLTPVRGFGLLWKALGGVNSGLGWATVAEVGFDSARQPAGRVSYTTYVQGPDKLVYAMTELPNSEVGYWTTVAG